MGQTYSVMVRPVGEQRAEDLLTDASTILGQKFQLNEYGHYQILTGRGPLFLDLDAQQDYPGMPMPWEDFPWEFNIDAGKREEQEVIVLDVLHRLYDGLVATGKYHVVLNMIDTDEVFASNYPGYEKAKDW